MIEPFDIQVTIGGQLERLRVVPENNQVEPHEYKLFKGEEYLGKVWPDCIDEGVCWYTSDLIAEDTLLKIGDAIERVEA